MWGKAVILGVLASSCVAPAARAGEDLTPGRRRALEQEAAKLNAQGVAQNRQGKLAEAAAAFEKVLAIDRRLYPQGHPNLAASLHNLGGLLRTRRDFDAAEPLLREAVDLYRRFYPKGHPQLSSSLVHLGGLLEARGDFAGAERSYRDALANDRRLHPKGHPDLADTLTNLGALLTTRGDFDGAGERLREAVTLYRRFYPAGHADLAVGLNNLGALLHAQGDFAGAEPLFREAQDMNRRLFPKGNPGLATSLNNLGALLLDRGDYVEAEPVLRAALDLRRQLFPRGHPDLAVSLVNLGGLRWLRGDFAGAEALEHEALEMRRRLFPKGHPDLAISLVNLGGLLWAQGEYAGAEPLLRKAVDMFRRLYPKGHPQLAHSLNSLGMVRLNRGDLDGAGPPLREAVEMRRRLYPKDHPDLAAGLNNLGGLLREQGDLTGAEPLLREALDMYRRLHPRDHPNLARSLSNMDALLQARGDQAGAEQHAREALAMYQRILRTFAALAAEAEALDMAASFPRARDAFLSVTRGRPARPADYDLLWQGRSALTRILEQRHRDLLASRDPGTRRRGDQLASARQRLARLLLFPAPDSRQHAQEIRDWTAVKERLEKDLAEKLRLELPAAAEPPPPAALAAALPADAAFLDFYRYIHFEFDPKVPGRKGERRTPHYAAFVVARGRPAVRVELGEAGPLEKAWAAWHQAITRGAPDAQERRAAAALAQRVWEPLRSRLPAGVRTLYLTPDGVLTQVPFAALPGKKAGTVLLEEYAFASIPHGPYLLDRLARKDESRPASGGLLVVGGIDYRRPAPGPPLAWQELPGTGAELKRVAALAEKHARLKARRLTGADATTAAVLAALPRARYAHLATHGFFADARLRSAFQVDPATFATLGSKGRRGGARSPLALSGLIFAGANRTGDEADPDRGILTAEAVVGLRLEGMELAVLSACNTGLGEVGGGEGVYGLQRALHLAGCQNVVASLWAVGDQSTEALMALFYRNLWERKLDPLQALRQAQLELYRRPGRVQEVAKREDGWSPRPLPEVDPGAAGPRARTAQWAAFAFSGVAAPAGRGATKAEDCYE